MAFNGKIIAGLLVVLAIGYYFMYFRGTKQNFEKVQLTDPAVVTPPLSGIGYSIEPAPEKKADINDYADDADPTSHAGYARLATEKKESAMDRMQADAEASSISRSAAAATPFNLDVANPTSWNFTAGVPRATIMDRRKLDADPFRGDIPIKQIAGFANPIGAVTSSYI